MSFFLWEVSLPMGHLEGNFHKLGDTLRVFFGIKGRAEYIPNNSIIIIK